MPSSLPFPHREAISNTHVKRAAAAKLALGKKVVLLLPGRAPLATDQRGPGWQGRLQDVTGSPARDRLVAARKATVLPGGLAFRGSGKMRERLNRKF